jgi:hypothetical protein
MKSAVIALCGGLIGFVVGGVSTYLDDRGIARGHLSLSDTLPHPTAPPPPPPERCSVRAQGYTYDAVGPIVSEPLGYGHWNHSFMTASGAHVEVHGDMIEEDAP